MYSSVCLAPPLWLRSIRRRAPPKKTHLISGRDYSRHDQLAPPRHKRLWRPRGGPGTHRLPCSPLTVKRQRPPVDCSQKPRLMIDTAVVRRLNARFNRTKLSHVVKGKVLCLPSRGDLFMILLLNCFSLVCFCCLLHDQHEGLHIKSVISCCLLEPL